MRFLRRRPARANGRLEVAVALPRSRIVKINRLLSWVVVGIGMYLVALPLLPYVHFYIYAWNQEAPLSSNISVSPRVAQAIGGDNYSVPVPEDNRLQIPAIGVDGTIYEGNSVELLNKGIWRRPKTSMPDEGGNTVFVAHRFLYRSGPNTFYLLDKVTAGDEITVWWKKIRYRYRVIDSRLVEPDALEIEHATSDARLTLYTCAPLFSSSKRLVVTALLVTEK